LISLIFFFSHPKWGSDLNKKERPVGTKKEKENRKRSRDVDSGMSLIAQQMARKNDLLAQKEKQVNHSEILALLAMDNNNLSPEDEEILSLMKKSAKQRFGKFFFFFFLLTFLIDF
jgi:hypothetical protein